MEQEEDANQPVGHEKVVCCVLLAFGKNSGLEADFQLEHSASRVRYDVIRAGLRLAAWLSFTARAAARASGGSSDGSSGGAGSGHTLLAMLLAAVVYSLAPMALLVTRPMAYLRCGAWPSPRAGGVVGSTGAASTCTCTQGQPPACMPPPPPNRPPCPAFCACPQGALLLAGGMEPWTCGHGVRLLPSAV